MLLRQCNNRILQEELDYDRDSLAVEHIELFNGLNFDQRNIYDVVIDSVLRNKEGKIVIAVASSGIAALLLPGGRTAHSRFQIPIIVIGSSTCGIKQAVDHSLRDILRFTGSDSANKPFGGKTVVLGGDFRQILPVVAKGRREQIVEASINKSSLWNNCRVFILTKNMRLTQNPGDIAAREFSEWILKVGDGELNNSESEALIEIPHDLLIQPGSHPFNDIMNATYPDFHTKFNDSKYLEEREILAPRNEVVEDINDYMIDLINVDEETYLSADSICKASTNILNQDVMYPTEFLNSLKVPGIPNHKLRLKFHMNMEYTTLKEISRDKENLKVKVRVLRMWDAVNRANDHDLISLDMILVDKEVNS
ncbi:uncharacterized protein LOC142605877 [Castanea sativa]|uniref:uncharacterized protein LOC142605877 n=1 Tax=Castanea sativa TaxID=21020 RepID=UPI003F649349